MPSIKTKAQLDDLLALMVEQFEILFATNGNKNLTAAKLRTYMQSQIDYMTILNASLRLQRLERIELDGANEIILPEDIDENLLYLHSNTETQLVELPPITLELDGMFIRGVLLTPNDTTFVPVVGDSINGGQPMADNMYKITASFLKQTWLIEFKGF